MAAGLTEKMVRRNPHVFGAGPSDLTSAQVNDQWQREKADEKQRSSVTDGLPPGPAGPAVRRQGARPAGAT